MSKTKNKKGFRKICGTLLLGVGDTGFEPVTLCL